MALNASPAVRLTPTQNRTQLVRNYISLFDYSNQFLPDTHDMLAGIYGNQSITGLLYMLGTETSFESDEILWTEEGRLHTVYTSVTRSNNIFTQANHLFRVNETVHLSDADGTVRTGVITATATNTFTVAMYSDSGVTDLDTTGITAFVYGSEFRQGTSGMVGSLDKDLTIRENSPIIQKDRFEVSGSRVTQISWVQTELGYYWYMNSERDTRRRWEDRMELSMILSELAGSSSAANTANFKGTEGLFSAVRSRGNVFDGLATTLTQWDSILKRFDAQGKIMDYSFYVDRDQSLAIDNLLGTLNAGYQNGISYGMFPNGEEMAVNLGFRSFKRGSYNFHKTDWKLLNDPTLLGAVDVDGKVRGMLIPMGSTEVYDGKYQMGGMSDPGKISVPFLMSKYRMAGSENRRYKTWVLGTVGTDQPTNDNDSMEIHMLSERALCTVGANNFMIFQGN